MKKIPFTGLIVLSLLLVSPMHALAQTGGQLQERAASVAVKATYPNAIQPQHLLYEAKPGQVIEDYITLKNMGTSDSISTYLYGADDTKTAEGNIAFKTKSDTMETTGTWLSFTETAMTLLPQEEKTVKVTIKIPEDTSFGDYIGGIAVESLQPNNGGSINVALRYLMQAKIKVTDNPQVIPKIASANIMFLRPGFWIGTFIFLGCMWYFIRASRKEKLAKKQLPIQND